MPDAFNILLAHHPDAFDAAAEVGIPLTLAGPYPRRAVDADDFDRFRPLALPLLERPLYQKGASQLIVSNGAGNWFPLRINTPAEIIHLTLEPA